MNRTQPNRPSQPLPARDTRIAGAVLAVAVAFAGAVVGGLVWLSGEVAGWAWRGKWPATPLKAAPVILARLPAHLSDPARAWPEPARASLPAAPAMVMTCAVMLAAAVAVVVAGSAVARAFARFAGRVRPRPAPRAAPGRGTASRRAAPWKRQLAAGGRWPGGREGGAHPARFPASMAKAWPGGMGAPRWAGSFKRGRRPGARWANRRDLRPLIVSRPGGARLVLGRAGRALVATEHRHSALVVGPTQSGKTSGLAIPAILEWEGPVVATSVKGDLAMLTAGWRSRRGRCWIFDPTATSGVGPAVPWSPLSEAATWSAAQRMASWLVEATPARGGLSDAAFWYSAAAKLLAPLLLAAQRGGATMADIVRWNNQGDFEEPAEMLGSAGEAEAGVALFACAERDERIRSSVATTLETVLSPFEDPVVARSTAASVIDPVSLVHQGATLYLCGPSFEQARLAGLFAALVSAVIAAAVEAANRRGRPLDPPLLLVLDEAANIAPIRDLDTLAATGAGLGIQLVTLCQDLAQFVSRYGEERARTIANNHRAKLILSGVSDLATLDLVSGLAGEHAVREETLTADLRDGRRTRSSSFAYRRLAPADELRRTPPGHGVLIYGHLPAARVELRPWFGDRHLAERAVPRKER